MSGPVPLWRYELRSFTFDPPRVVDSVALVMPCPACGGEHRAVHEREDTRLVIRYLEECPS